MVEMRVVNSVLLLLLASRVAGRWDDTSSPLSSRDDFPTDFVFGAGTSAYQVEGAAAEDGRTPSIWDTYAHAGYVQGTGDIASDEYHKYKEDVRLMAQTGLEGYRFSISWSRLIPNGRGKVNPKGLEYYNNLINELLSYGIEPHATLFHYDHPQILEDEYGGWISPKIVDDFTAYADVCFREFGDRISHWTTLNEPNVFLIGGYDRGFLPPTRCSYPFGNCSHGDSTLEPYIAARHCLLAHNSAAQLYKRKYKDKQQGFIGLNVFVYYFLPLTNSVEDINATKRAQDFYTGWFVEPLVHGDYPETMKKAAGTKMLGFSKNQSKQLMDSFDFIGLNYYNTVYVMDSPNNAMACERDWFGDMAANITYAGKTDEKSGTEFDMVAYGLQGVLEYFKKIYGNPPIYIQENGLPMQHTLDDSPRVKFLTANIRSLLNSLRNGSNILGYFTWSFIDAFELLTGYQYTYGLYYVDFRDEDLKRYPKLSAQWYSNFLKGRWHNSCTNNSSTLLSTVDWTLHSNLVRNLVILSKKKFLRCPTRFLGQHRIGAAPW